VTYLAQLFHDLGLGPGGEVGLYRVDDGAVIARKIIGTLLR
jgi:hypothetical protein